MLHSSFDECTSFERWVGVRGHTQEAGFIELVSDTNLSYQYKTYIPHTYFQVPAYSTKTVQYRAALVCYNYSTGNFTRRVRRVQPAVQFFFVRTKKRGPVRSG